MLVYENNDCLYVVPQKFEITDTKDAVNQIVNGDKTEEKVNTITTKYRTVVL